MEKATKNVLAWALGMMVLAATMVLFFTMTPATALAEGPDLVLTAAKPTAQAQSLTPAKQVAAKNKPYVDVTAKTVDKTGRTAIKYVKAHKGFYKVVNGKRFYPEKTFTRAQYTKILRNLYGNKVALSKSKAPVTGKYACDQLTKVAKDVFGVGIKWKSGNGKAKLSRTAVANYVKTFATWNNGVFAPKR